MEKSAAFDLNATVAWVKGVLSDPQGTAVSYRETGAPWQATLMRITLPVYVAAAVVGYLLALVFGGGYMYAAGGGPVLLVLSLAWSVAYVFVAAFIFDFFAGTFGGQRSFDGAFAVLSLAMIPAALGGALGPLPWLGWLIALAAGIYGMVLAYRFIPVFMSVPEDKRVLHFVVSLVVAILVNMVVSAIVFAGAGPAVSDYPGYEQSSDRDGSVFGGLERQADLAEQASRDEYQPPRDGRLTEAQVATLVRTLERTRELRERLSSRFDDMKEENASVGAIFSGVGDAVRLGTAEQEVVKTAGGNWAEHQWVKNQLEVARVQQDGNPAVEHNYQLFRQYRDAIERHE